MDNQLQALVEKWREESNGVDAMGYSQQADRMRDCADELAALLAQREAARARENCGTCEHWEDPILRRGELRGACYSPAHDDGREPAITGESHSCAAYTPRTEETER